MSTDRKQLLQYAIAVLVVGGIGLGLIMPLWHNTKQTRLEIGQLERDLGIKRGRTDGLSALAMEVDGLRSRIAANNKVIPPRIELAEVLRELSVQIESENLVSQGISTEAAVDGTDYTALPLELTLSGRAPAIFRFVDRIESMPRMIQVNSLDIETDKPTDQAVEAKVKLHTFYSGKGGEL
jgi:Tfp pilus assembly protein PilO